MTYKINGTTLLLEPTSGQWLGRTQIGTDGNGHPIYSPVRSFEIRWGLLDPATSNQLQNFFATVITTGTAVVEIPQYAAATYVFYAYSGCVLSEPDVSRYFNENIQDVRLLITGIRT